VILFVVDTRSGLAPLDQEVGKRLRYVDVPVICGANKTDSESLENEANEFCRLERGKLVRVSAKENRNRDELMWMILERLPVETDDPPPEDPTMKVAIVGRQNVGKSTSTNTLAEADRMIVSEVPGTTRDSVDVRFELDGKSFMAIDTPGLRCRTSIVTDVDFYSLHRTQRSIRRADVVLLFFDCSQTVSKVDKQLCTYIVEQYKPSIFVVNKWDLYQGQMSTENWCIISTTPSAACGMSPSGFITGQTGRNVKALLNHAQMLFKKARSRVGTAELNRVLRAAVERNPPPMVHGRTPRIYYAT
jgi:GTP-binding protein